MNVPSFFIPDIEPGNAEEVYADFAGWCGVPVPALAERVYSITFGHEGEEWTATVGHTLVGRTLPLGRGKKYQPPQPRHDPATVLAIFPGSPWYVVTDHILRGDVGSRFANPFMCGRGDVARFAHGPEQVTR